MVLGRRIPYGGGTARPSIHEALSAFADHVHVVVLARVALAVNDSAGFPLELDPFKGPNQSLQGLFGETGEQDALQEGVLQKFFVLVIIRHKQGRRRIVVIIVLR